MNEAKRLLSDGCYMNCDAPPRPPEIAQIVETAYSVLDNGKQNSNAYSPRVPFESPILVHAAKPKTKLEWALAHARMGFNVFPLKPNRKKPLIEGWQIAAGERGEDPRMVDEEPGRQHRNQYGRALSARRRQQAPRERTDVKETVCKDACKGLPW